MIGAAHLMMRGASGPVQPKGLFAWGINWPNGQLGLGDVIPRSSPTQVGSLTDWSAVEGRLSGNQDNWSCATYLIKTDNTLWACGGNQTGELGCGDRITRSSPVQVGSGTDWSQISAGANGDASELGDNTVAAIKTTGSLWTWGGKGGMGYSNKAMYGRPAPDSLYSSPVQVGALLDWAKIAITHNTMCAIKTDGTLWAWGMGNNGQLGIPDRVTRSSPCQVGASSSWSKITGCQGFYDLNGFLAIRNDKTLWAWGSNIDYGNLGLGDRTPRSSPIQVGSATDWEQVNAGDGHVIAIRTGGTLWAWGYNVYGQLGLGNRTHYSSPVQVGTDTNWSKVYTSAYSSFAIKTNGTLWAWGNNANGQLGLGNRDQRSSPVQVGAGTNWTGLSIGGSGWILGVRT